MRTTVAGAGSTATPSSGPATEAELVSALVARDARTFEHLYDRWSAVTFAIAHRALGDAALAEQVLEDAFLSLWRRPGAALVGHRTVGEYLCDTVRTLSGHAATTPIAARRRVGGGAIASSEAS